VEFLVLQVAKRGLDNTLLLPPVHCQLGRTIGTAHPRLHFHEYQRVPVQGDRVEFRLGRRLIVFQDGVSPECKMLRGMIFARPSQHFPEQAHRDPARSISATGWKLLRCASQGP